MKTKLRKTYNIIIRLTILVLTAYFLYDQIFRQRNLTELGETMEQFSGAPHFYLLLLLTCFLLLVNLFLETAKWRFLIAKLEKVSFWNAFKAVLTGISVSMFMPNRVGDYLGRVFILEKADRVQAVLSTILGSLAQLITTLLFGLASIAFVYPHYYGLDDNLKVWLYVGLLILLSATAFLLVFAYLEFAAFSDILKRITGREYNRIKKYARVFEWYTSRDLLKVLILSILRYFVFSFQFYLLLHLFGIRLGYGVSMMLIGLIYLLMTVIPTVALTELGIRGSVSIFVFEWWLQQQKVWSETAALGVVSASSALWLLNLAFPALAGVFFVFSLKFFRKEPALS